MIPVYLFSQRSRLSAHNITISKRTNIH